ncbi:MAG: sulfatase [Planctomycetota bacterium]
MFAVLKRVKKVIGYMKSVTSWFLMCLVIFLGCGITPNLASATDKPNIILIFIDDMGYADIGPFGNKVNKTPNLDRMAREGNVLLQFYVSNTACTPSRSALMTGTYAQRIGMDESVVFPGEDRGLHPDEMTIAEMLRGNGYATGCFGKWHLGDQKPFLPLAQGFDEYFGIPYSNDMWPGNKRGNPVTDRGPYEPLPVIRGNEAIAYISDGADQSLLCEAVTNEAIEFIKQHHDAPFFCYIPHSYIHYPYYARPEIMNRAEGDPLRANIEEVDDSVGRILDVLRKLKLAEKTLVVFTSDNGGRELGPLRGKKGGPKYEGHMRVPTLAWWPGTIPGGSRTEAIATTTDLLPTFAELTGTRAPTDRTIDGKDVLDVLLGKPNTESPHEILYYETEGVRRGDWKLVQYAVNGKGIIKELYNLKTDLGERQNLATQHPAILTELSELLALHAARIAGDTRPAGFVKNAKPILAEPGDLPRLRDYMGLPHTTAPPPAN